MKRMKGRKVDLFLVAVFMCFALVGSTFALVVPSYGFYHVEKVTGQVVIFPFYDVRSDAAFQYFSITNTADDWVQGHIRFRSGKYSVEVLDFDVILSPHDVFTFLVIPNVDGKGTPGFASFDVDTLKNSSYFLGGYYDSATGTAYIPFMTSRLEAVGISSADALEQAKYGYVEFIPEGAVDDDFMDANNDDQPDYDTLLKAVEKDFKDGDDNGDDNPIDYADYPGNDFMATEWFFDGNSMAGYAINADLIADFRTENHAHLDDGYRPDATGLYSGMNGLILHEDIGTKQDPSDPFYRPDWTTTYGPTLAFGDDYDAAGEGGMVTPWGSVDEVESVLDKSKLRNHSPWMARWIDYNGNLETYALLTFPTKYFHFFTKLLYAPNDPNRNGKFTLGKDVDRTNDNDYNVDVTKQNFNINYEFVAYDTQENTYTPGGTISPLRGGEKKVLKEEVNYVSVGAGKDMDTHYDTEGWFAISNFELANANIREGIDDNITIGIEDEIGVDINIIPPVGFVVHDIPGAYQTSIDWIVYPVD